MTETINLKVFKLLAAVLLVLAGLTVNVSSIWVLSYQPKTPKCLIER